MEHEIKHVAVSRRIRHLGLVDNPVETAAKQAEDPHHGYVLGRLLIDRTINQRQHDAGIMYAEAMSRFYGLTGLPFPSARAQNLFAVRGNDGEESQSRVDAAKRAKQAAGELRHVLQSCGDINTGRRVERTVAAICVEDIDELRTLNLAQRAWLVRGLNALARHFGG